MRRCLPYIRFLMKSVKRLAEKDAVVSAANVAPVKPGSQTKPGGKPLSRGIHTSSRSRNPNRKSRASDNRFTYSKKIIDSFFKVISKEGTLVALRMRERMFSTKLGKLIWKKLPYPHISALFRKVGFRMFGACFPLKGKYSSRLRQLHAFLVHIQNMTRNHGPSYVVKYLKTSQLAIQKAIAGTPLSSLNQVDPSLAFPSLSSSGLPKFIPLRDRRLMLRNSSASVIRWWLTLYSVYRVIYIPGTLKLSTITDPMTVSLESVVSVAEEMMIIINPSNFDTSKFFGKAKFLFLESASATARVSWLGFVADVVPLAAHNHLHLILDFLRLSGNNHLAGFINYISQHVPLYTDLVLGDALGTLDRPIGKLKTKKEAAGKVRVFAMVDVWTQSALKPLHEMLFSFLRTLPNDGTFDQNKSVERCFVKVAATGKSFGYDLSAATDRLPIVLQTRIIDKIIPGFGKLWAKLLVSRSYHISEKDYDVEDTLHYEVGQPMGAYSSWGMLAVTHHYIAQLAAVKALVTRGASPEGSPFWILGSDAKAIFNLPSSWYTGYEVLGDDIVFFEEDVAHEYLSLMDRLGVPINLSKSVIGKNPTFEFAKVTGHRGHHVAAVSWAMFMAQPSIMGRAGIAYSLIGKGIVRSHIISWLRTFARQSRYTEGSDSTFYLALGTMFSRKGKMDYFAFLYSIMQKTLGYYNVYSTLLEKANTTVIKQAISAIVKTGGSVQVPNPVQKRRGWKTDEFELKTAVWTTINTFMHGSNLNGRVISALNPHRDATLLAKELLCTPPMMLGLTGDRLLKAEHRRVFTLDKGALQHMDQYEAFIHHLFCYLFVYFYDKLTVLQMEIENKTQFGQADLSLGELLDVVDIIDRYKEVLLLVRRMIDKLANKTVPDRNLEDSPLAVLQQLMYDGDPFGPRMTGPTPSIYGGSQLQDYLYAVNRVESFIEYNVPMISDGSPVIPDYYSPLSSQSGVKLTTLPSLDSPNKAS